MRETGLIGCRGDRADPARFLARVGLEADQVDCDQVCSDQGAIGQIRDNPDPA